MPDLCLAIEISNPSADPGPPGTGPGVALGRLIPGRDVEHLGTELISRERRHDDDLMPAIDRLFTRCGAGPRDLARVGVSIGPGGFTSLRIAVAAAKMICEATGAACVGVPSAEVVARRVAAPGAFAVALASKGDTAFVTRFTAPPSPDGPGRLVGAGDLEALAVQLLIADRFLPDSLRERAAAAKIGIGAPVFDPGACLECAAEAHAVDPLELLPLYPRLPEAVVKWRELHPER